ncbi:hypothetical protein EAN88_19000 [Klebsiella pneumoniae]|nr:hypothetical protein [Klebsiella pneumoniae]RRE48019.1 hypothetical protein EAN88_19000 [Klebsiella pneumoniae]
MTPFFWIVAAKWRQTFINAKDYRYEKSLISLMLIMQLPTKSSNSIELLCDAPGQHSPRTLEHMQTADDAAVCTPHLH